MNDKIKFDTPVAFFIFNRPWITAKSFNKIKMIKPKNLYIIADGPRDNNKNDIIRCEETRNIVKNIDWDCNLNINFAEKNLGMKERNISGLNWLFSKVDMAIILEDDNLADLSFFRFASELLNYYKNNKKIFQITGVNWQDGIVRNNASYYFSKYNHLWGWATWKRCWEYYDKNIPYWSHWKKTHEWKEICPDPIERIFWTKLFNTYVKEEVNSWAYPWLLTAFYHKGLTVVPNKNLVRNIGFFGGGTHEFSQSTVLEKETHSLNQKIIHPKNVECDDLADQYAFNNIFDGKNLRSTKNRIKFFLYDKFN